MKYHFNLYDSRHYGWELNYIDDETYQKFIDGEDDDYSDLNVLSLELDSSQKYWLDIAEDYNYWSDNRDFKLYQTEPSVTTGFLFYIEYDHGWKTKLM